MIFLKTKEPNYGDYVSNMTRVEINTLSELEAFAMAGCGRVELNFTPRDRDGTELNKPTIRLLEEEE